MYLSAITLYTHNLGVPGWYYSFEVKEVNLFHGSFLKAGGSNEANIYYCVWFVHNCSWLSLSVLKVRQYTCFRVYCSRNSNVQDVAQKQ